MNKQLQLHISKEELDRHMKDDDTLTINIKLEDEGIVVDVVILDSVEGNDIFITSTWETYSELGVQMLSEDD
jgi:hypothetical protein